MVAKCFAPTNCFEKIVLNCVEFASDMSLHEIPNAWQLAFQMSVRMLEANEGRRMKDKDGWNFDSMLDSAWSVSCRKTVDWSMNGE